ncbi:MAG: COX15/CtaA family protein [Gammaproteobacteria bacterium]
MDSAGPSRTSSWTYLALGLTLLSLTVSVLGAYVRLSHAGLSCPDWPGCYGQALVPGSEVEIENANAAYPQRPVDVPRAWKEMVHRYLAGLLGLGVLVLAVWSLRRRHHPYQPRVVPWVLLGLVMFQAALGMWTVTLLLKPLIVMGHLLGGFTTVALLAWVTLRSGRMGVRRERPYGRSALPWIVAGVVVLYAQISLGGWTGANYAALACPDFPLCQGQLVPPLDLSEALRPWRGIGQSYEGGVLANDARVTIHLLHRAGALITFFFLGALGLMLAMRARGALAAGGLVLAAGVTLQALLGIGNVVLGLPIGVAVAHNGIAASLLVALLVLWHLVSPPTPRPNYAAR